MTLCESRLSRARSGVMTAPPSSTATAAPPRLRPESPPSTAVALCASMGAAVSATHVVARWVWGQTSCGGLNPMLGRQVGAGVSSGCEQRVRASDTPRPDLRQRAHVILRQECMWRTAVQSSSQSHSQSGARPGHSLAQTW
jgi:hypothetical protein